MVSGTQCPALLQFEGKGVIGDDSNWRIIGPLFPSKILTSYSFLRELKQLPRALRGNKKAKAKSRRENQS